MAEIEWTTRFFIIGKEVKELRYQDIVKSSNLDIRMVILCSCILSWFNKCPYIHSFLILLVTQ